MAERQRSPRPTKDQAERVPGFADWLASPAGKNYRGVKGRPVGWEVLGPLIYDAWLTRTPALPLPLSCDRTHLDDEMERPMREAWQLVGFLWKQRKHKPTQWQTALHMLRALAKEAGATDDDNGRDERQPDTSRSRNARQA